MVKWANLEVSVDVCVNWLNEHPNLCAIGAITSNGLFVLDADTPESKKAIETIQTRHKIKSNLVVETKSGFHFYYRVETSLNAFQRGYSSIDSPHKIDIRTGKSIIVLPPSIRDGKQAYFLENEKEIPDLNELTLVTAEFLEAIYKHNGVTLPEKKVLAPKLRLAPQYEPYECNVLRELLTYIGAGCDYQRWLEILMAVKSKFGNSEEAYKIVDSWSKTGHNYKSSTDVYRTLDSLSIEGLIQYGTVIMYAQERGANFKAINKKYRPKASEVFAKLPVKDTNIIDVRKLLIDYKSQLPNINLSSNKPLKTHENLNEICIRLGVQIRYNVITKSEEIIIPNKGFTKDNEANASLAWLKSECAKFYYNPEWVDGYITYLAEGNKYNPVVTWIESRKWDGIDRLSDLLNTVTATGSFQLKETLITKWLISAVAAAYSCNGISAQGILVFQGEQSLGKTRWFNSLVPKELNLIKDGFLLNPSDKDSVKQACSFWLVELGEIDSTFRKSDIAALKAFVTADQDIIRNPYARKESRYARRTIFFGSVNPEEFLADSTGNRRYWTIPCVSISHNHSIDMQQLWAQVKAMIDSGAKYYLTCEELALLNEHNEQHLSTSIIEELMLAGSIWEAPKKEWIYKTASQVLKQLGIFKPNKKEINEAASLIKKRNGNIHKRTGNGRFLLVPPHKNIFLPTV